MSNYLIKLKKLGVNFTLLATSISLVACGGGGSEGYFNNEGSGSSPGNNSGGNESTPDSSQVAESLNINLRDSSGESLIQAIDNSNVQITVQVLNADKGGISNKNVRLSINDSENLGITSKSSLVTTAENGIAVFEVNIPRLNTQSGKVQITATLDGTTIKQIYTLNIAKTSTVQSNYNLNVQQGVVLNIPKGSVTINAQVTDQNGGVKTGQNVILALPKEMQEKFSISSGSSLTTDNKGNVSFTITSNSDLSAEEIQNFIGTSQSLEFKLIDEYQAQRIVKAAITFKDISQIVQKLEIIKEDTPIVAQGGSTIIKVRAKNSNDIPLANKKVKLIFTDKSDAYGVSLDQTEVTTNAAGYAEFIVRTNSSYPIALSQQGINLKALYTDNAEVFAQDTVSVITTNTGATDQLALQRLEIASSYKINAKNDSVSITVKGINNKGEAATKGKVTLSLNSEALANGVTFEGSAEQEFRTGYVTYILKTNAKTEAAVADLVQAGITATFKTDNNLTNTIKIAVEDEAKSEEAVGYLTIDPINNAFDYTKDQTVELRVKAVGVKGSALKGETINISLPALVTSDLQALGLSLMGQSSTNTDETGYATFRYQYKANNSERQRELVGGGIRITATSASDNAQQSIILNFKAPTEQNEIDLDYLTVDMPGNLVLKPGIEQTIQVAVKATGTNGTAYASQKIGIGLNEAALSNGVSLATASSLITNSSGQAVFSLKVKANSVTELTNLIANGITISVKGYRKDGSSYLLTRKIDISQPPVILPNLAGLAISYDMQTVSVLGGEVRVKVIAKDSAGNIIPNTPLALALSGLAGSRVSLSDSALSTNSKGEAEFSVKVAEGTYDANLIKNGITFAVVGTNLNNGDRIQQTGTIQVAIPRDSVNLRLTSEQDNLELGKAYQIEVAVKDELGANTAYPVNLTLNSEAVTAGVRLSADSVMTSANTSVPVSITLPKNIPEITKQALLTSGIKVYGFITNPKGEKLETVLNFTVSEVINTNHLILQSSKTNLSVNGDRAIITATLLDQNNQPVRNQAVKLSANNSATLIIGTPGAGHPTNTSEPQTVITDSNGNAFFSVEIDSKTVDGGLLVASGIELTASHTNEAGTITQIHRLAPFRPVSVDPQPARYNVRIQATKPSLNVRNDLTDVTVTLVDANGGGISDKYIELAIEDFNRNGAIIVGPSGLTTNINGQATFKVQIDEFARAVGYDAASFAADDLKLTAKFKEDGYLEATQTTQVNIVQSLIQNPVASIVIGVNPTEVTSSTDGVYYTRNLSVSVVDFDGKPLSKQEVKMDITPILYTKGQYKWELVTDALGNQKEDWVIHPTAGCLADPNGTAVTNGQVINIPVKVPTFLGSESTVATYTTDAQGKFDFTIRYPKIYAQWLTVQIGAASTVATLPARTTYNLGLASLKSDYSTDGSYGPNLTSPYGTNFSCP